LTEEDQKRRAPWHFSLYTEMQKKALKERLNFFLSNAGEENSQVILVKECLRGTVVG